MNTEDFLDIQLEKITNIVVSEELGNGQEAFFSVDSIDETRIYKNDDISEKISNVFGLLHHELNKYLNELNDSFKEALYRNKTTDGIKAGGIFFRNGNSFRYVTKVYKDLYEFLKDSRFSFRLDKDYSERIDVFYKYSFPNPPAKFSTIPINDYVPFDLIEYNHIFHLNKESNELVKNGLKNDFVAKQIGEGSYAITYKITDKFYNKKFALKKAKKDISDTDRARFKQEFELLKGFNNPNIVKVYKIINEPLEYLMDYCDTDLYRLYNGKDKISMAQMEDIAHQIMSAFEYVHSKGVLHRDISPNNILLNKFDNSYVVKINDFGLSKNPKNQMTSVMTDVKGWFHDPNLDDVGFSQYAMPHEIYELTRVIYYVMTKRINYHNIPNNSESIGKFVDGGTNSNENLRYKSVVELEEAFRNTEWETEEDIQ